MNGRRLRRPIIAMVTDRRQSAASQETGLDMVVAAAGRAARAGVDLIQIRERDIDDRSLLALVAGVRNAVGGTHAQVLVNDRIDLAMASQADGVHLPAQAVAASRARAMVPEGFLVGRSVHSEPEALAADHDGGCDYLIFGSVFASASKRAGHPVAGPDALARVCESVRLPVLGIGGITVERAPEVARAGASGIAAIGLFATADEVTLRSVVSRLRDAFD
jgi:thiamine-phosphate diphosphorylase